jgi:hypothetical protein
MSERDESDERTVINSLSSHRVITALKIVGTPANLLPAQGKSEFSAEPEYLGKPCYSVLEKLHKLQEDMHGCN